MDNAKVESGDIANCPGDQPCSSLIRSLHTFLRGLIDRIHFNTPAANTQPAMVRVRATFFRIMVFTWVILCALVFLLIASVAIHAVSNNRLHKQLDWYENALARCLTAADNHTTASNDTTASLLTREAAANRRCLTGYTAQELVLESELMAEKYGHKARIYMSSCSDVSDLGYPSNVVAEYNYVVFGS